ncbi:MAG: acyl-CoA carboxylase subunit beta [Chloroflexota bacterium]
MNRIEDIEARRRVLFQGGGAAAAEKQHQSGKLTVRERLERLLDRGTFQEIDLWVRAVRTGFDIDERELPGDACVTGLGRIDGRAVYVYAQDFTVLGGTFGAALRHKVSRVMEMARESGLPCIGLVDSGGERIHDRFGFTANRPILSGTVTGGSSAMYFHPGINSGVVPQITVMLGPSYAGSAYSPTMADFYIMRDRVAFMSVASPELLKSATFADVTQEEIGGAKLHATVTGTADFLTDTDEEAIAICRELVGYLPMNHREKPPVVDTGDKPDRREGRLQDIVPSDLSKPYDMHEIVRCVVDGGRFLEIQSLFARSLLTGFGRLNGCTIGIVANNPLEDAGVLNINTCDKEARFIRFCDCFNIPLVFLVDTCGFLPDSKEEQSPDGLLRTAPKPVFAICEATVPMVSVYIGKCFGTARLVMGNLRTGVDFAYSWPSAQVARVSPHEAVEALYRSETSASETPEVVREKRLKDLLPKYYNYPYHAAEQAMVNDIIDPRDTRPLLIATLENLAHKKPTPRPWRKHSLIPR